MYSSRSIAYISVRGITSERFQKLNFLKLTGASQVIGNN